MKIVYTFTNYKNAIVRDILAIVLGGVLMVWPGDALKYVIMLIGTIFLVSGLITLWITYKGQEERQRRLASFSGFGSIVLGLLLVCMPSVFVTVFMILLGFILIVGSLSQFVSIAAARQFGVVAPISYLFPALILISGIVVLFNPFKAAESVVFILFGVTAVFYGVTDLINQYTIHKMRKASEEKEKIVKMSGKKDIEDADYEEVK